MIAERRHFHTFDALRFFSFLVVFLHHVSFSNSKIIGSFTKSGGIGVSFFFVLSGFLITYILLNEKNSKGNISLKNFMVRRILRIWPLFYAMIAFAYLSPLILNYLNLPFSNDGYKPDFIFSSLFLENYKMMQTGTFPNGSPLTVMWSLCIEEHFYILWGLVFYFLSVKKVPYLLAFTIIMSNIVRIIYTLNSISTIDVFSNFDYFAYGAIPAYLLVVNNKIIGKIGEIPLFIKYFILIVTAVLVFVIPNIHFNYKEFIYPNIFGIFISFIIISTFSSQNPIYISDKALISKLGVYTYGLYLYHTIIINLILQINNLVSVKIHWLIVTLSSFIITVLVSILSYHLFEKQFLKLKKYFYN